MNPTTEEMDAAEDPSYQHCDMPNCSNWRVGDEGHWDCHDIGGVLCPLHDVKTREERAKCSESGCDACYDALFPDLRELYSSEEKQRAFIEAEGLDDEPGNHICWLALERALDGSLTTDEKEELAGAMEHEHKGILTRLAEKNGLPIPDEPYDVWCDKCNVELTAETHEHLDPYGSLCPRCYEVYAE